MFGFVDEVKKWTKLFTHDEHRLYATPSVLFTFFWFLFLGKKVTEKTKKSDFGPDEFKVIREIILAHPRLQKKER